MMRVFIGISIFLIYSFQLLGQIDIRHLTIKDGLTQGSAYYMLKDSRGFVWMSSEEGINRYDGTQIVSYTHSNNDTTTIGSGAIRGIVEDSQGDLWIGTSQCLNRYVRQKNSFERYYATTSSITNAFYANDHEVWYINDLQGIMAYNFQKKYFRHIFPHVKNQEHFSLSFIAHDTRRKGIWLLSNGQLLFYQYAPKYKSILYNNLISHQTITAFELDSTGNIWLGTNTSLYKMQLSPLRLTKFNFPPQKTPYSIYNIKESANHQQLAIAGNFGLLIFNQTNNRFEKSYTHIPNDPNSLANNETAFAMIDNQQIIWVNSDPISNDVILPQTYKVHSFIDNPNDMLDLNQNAIRGLAEDNQGYLWIGTISDGVRRYNRATGQFKKYTIANGLPDNSIRQIIVDKKGAIWVATAYGFCMFNAITDRFQSYSNPLDKQKYQDANYINGILPLKDNAFILSTLSGLFVFKGQSFKPFSDDNQPQTGALYLDEKEQLLYTAWKEKGIVIYDMKLSKPSVVSNLVKGSYVFSFYRMPNSNSLWICTNQGLLKYDIGQKKIITTLGTEQGLSSNVVYGILEENGYLWLSTNRGIVRFDPKREVFSKIKQDLLKEYNSNAYLKTQDGTLFFGSTTGLSYFKPLFPKQTVSTIVNTYITQLSINNKPAQSIPFIGELTQLDLKYSENTLAFDFVAIDYFSEGDISYSVQLEGFDRKRIQLGTQHSIRYTQLPPGNYQLKIYATNYAGIDAPPKVLAITITPPFWQTYLFKISVLFVLFLFIYLLSKYYFRSKLLEQRRRYRTIINTQESERQRIAQDLHDDIGNSLAAIKNIVSHQYNLPDIEQMLNQVSEDMRNISHNLASINFQQTSLIKATEILILRHNESSKHKIKYQFMVNGNEKRLQYDNEFIAYRIVCELLNNIEKHSQARNAIVQFSFTDTLLTIVVEDDGVGINKSLTNQKGIGMNNIESRVRFLNGTLVIDDDGNGTIIIVDIPLNK